MNNYQAIRTPWHQMPITVVMKATQQKVYRKMHCVNCGMPIADITDRIVMMFDGVTPFEQLEPDQFGIIEVHCDRHICKQYYRLEFAT